MQEQTADEDDFGADAEATTYAPRVVDPRDRFSIPS